MNLRIKRNKVHFIQAATSSQQPFSGLVISTLLHLFKHVHVRVAPDKLEKTSEPEQPTLSTNISGALPLRSAAARRLEQRLRAER